MTAQFRGLLGDGVLINWMDIPEETEDFFNEWYTYEHLPERVGIAGFLRGRRYVRVGAQGTVPGKWFTVYETEDLGTLAAQPYLDRLNAPTEWTTQIVEKLSYLSRTACAVTASAGRGTSAHIVTIEFGPGVGTESELRDWVTSVALPRLCDERMAVAAHLFEADVETTDAKNRTQEGSAQAVAGELARWLVFVELSEGAKADDVIDFLSGPDGLGDHGAAGDISGSAFDLIVELLAP